MPTALPFAQAIADMHAALVPMLANALVTIAGATVPAMFTSAYASATVGSYGMAASAPTLTLASAHVPPNPVGLMLEIDQGSTIVRYTIAAHEPNGSGLSRLLLECAA